eukprot:3941988-Rhodomonas_salina.1
MYTAWAESWSRGARPAVPLKHARAHAVLAQLHRHDTVLHCTGLAIASYHMRLRHTRRCIADSLGIAPHSAPWSVAAYTYWSSHSVYCFSAGHRIGAHRPKCCSAVLGSAQRERRQIADRTR